MFERFGSELLQLGQFVGWRRVWRSASAAADLLLIQRHWAHGGSAAISSWRYPPMMLWCTWPGLKLWQHVGTAQLDAVHNQRIYFRSTDNNDQQFNNFFIENIFFEPLKLITSYNYITNHKSTMVTTTNLWNHEPRVDHSSWRAGGVGAGTGRAFTY